MGLSLDAVTMLQHAVDPVKDMGNVFGGADMDVGGPLADSVHHDQLDQFRDDVARDGAGDLFDGADQLFHSLLDRVGDEEIGFFQGFLEVVTIYQKNPWLFAGQLGDRVHCHDVAGIGDADSQAAVFNQGKRHETALFCNILGNQMQCLCVRLHLCQINETEVKLLGNGTGKFAGSDKAHPDQQVAENSSGDLLLLQGDLQLFFAEQAPALEQFADLERCGHGGLLVVPDQIRLEYYHQFRTFVLVVFAGEECSQPGDLADERDLFIQLALFV